MFGVAVKADTEVVHQVMPVSDEETGITIDNQYNIADWKGHLHRLYAEGYLPGVSGETCWSDADIVEFTWCHTCDNSLVFIPLIRRFPRSYLAHGVCVVCNKAFGF